MERDKRMKCSPFRYHIGQRHFEHISIVRWVSIQMAKLGWTQSNYIRIPTRVPIYDLRGKENDVHLDINGFELHYYHGNIHQAFDDHSEGQQSYYEEIQNVLKNRLDASSVVVFWHVIRFRGPPRPADQCEPTHKNPVKNRFQIINVWRPLGPNPIVNTTLNICDYQSLDVKNDIHLSEVRGSESTVSLYVVSKNVKNSITNPNVARFGAHTAFINENAAPSADVEQCSVEMRCLVFYDQ